MVDQSLNVWLRPVPLCRCGTVCHESGSPEIRQASVVTPRYLTSCRMIGDPKSCSQHLNCEGGRRPGRLLCQGLLAEWGELSGGPLVKTQKPVLFCRKIAESSRNVSSTDEACPARLPANACSLAGKRVLAGGQKKTRLEVNQVGRLGTADSA